MSRLVTDPDGALAAVAAFAQVVDEVNAELREVEAYADQVGGERSEILTHTVPANIASEIVKRCTQRTRPPTRTGRQRGQVRPGHQRVDRARGPPFDLFLQALREVDLGYRLWPRPPREVHERAVARCPACTTEGAHTLTITEEIDGGPIVVDCLMGCDPSRIPLVLAARLAEVAAAAARAVA